MTGVQVPETPRLDDAAPAAASPSTASVPAPPPRSRWRRRPANVAPRRTATDGARGRPGRQGGDDPPTGGSPSLPVDRDRPRDGIRPPRRRRGAGADHAATPSRWRLPPRPPDRRPRRSPSAGREVATGSGRPKRRPHFAAEERPLAGSATGGPPLPPRWRRRPNTESGRRPRPSRRPERGQHRGPDYRRVRPRAIAVASPRVDRSRRGVRSPRRPRLAAERGRSAGRSPPPHFFFVFLFFVLCSLFFVLLCFLFLVVA